MKTVNPWPVSIALALVFTGCSTEFRPIAQETPYKSADLQGACNALLAGWLSVRDRCGVNLPDASDTCLRWPLSEACDIARCGWHLEATGCDLIEETRSDFCPCLDLLDFQSSELRTQGQFSKSAG